jgi:hypothetical protein
LIVSVNGARSSTNRFDCQIQILADVPSIQRDEFVRNETVTPLGAIEIVVQTKTTAPP